MVKLFKMKKIVLYLLIALSFACKKRIEDFSVIEGNYIFFDDAAVLQTSNEIYGVYLNNKTFDLNEKLKKLNLEQSDEIITKLKGIISTEKHEKILWEKKIEIIEIIEISTKKQRNKTLILGEE
ncbi:MAG: hypothetical protein CMC86_04755 [Flavobacteriaceae bacterium]|nr:hypothetical protein [Flavobacteriaceae bacterium]